MPPGWTMTGWQQDGKVCILVSSDTGVMEMERQRLDWDYITAARWSDPVRRAFYTAEKVDLKIELRQFTIITADDLRTALNRAFEILRRPKGPFAN